MILFVGNPRSGGLDVHVAGGAVEAQAVGGGIGAQKQFGGIFFRARCAQTRAEFAPQAVARGHDRAARLPAQVGSQRLERGSDVYCSGAAIEPGRHAVGHIVVISKVGVFQSKTFGYGAAVIVAVGHACRACEAFDGRAAQRSEIGGRDKDIGANLVVEGFETEYRVAEFRERALPRRLLVGARAVICHI